VENPYDHQPDGRRFSDSDIEALVSALKKSQDYHICRFSDIEPGDLKAVVDSHRKINEALDDSKTVVRRFFLVLVLTGLSGYAVYGWWAKVVDVVKKSIPGGPQ
jgi:hypothetical protein